MMGDMSVPDPEATNPDPTSRDRSSAESLRRRTDAVLRVGTLMLGAGTGSYRVKQAMRRTARVLGIDRIEAEVTLSEITVTSSSGGDFRTAVAEVPSPGVNADRIAEMESLTSSLRPGTTVAQLHRVLDDITARKPHYHWIVSALASAMACASFAFLNNGGWAECAGAALGAGLGQALRVQLGRRHLNQLAVTLLASALACLVYMVFTHGLFLATGYVSPRHEAGFTSAVLFLVPGFPLMTAALDLARFDLTAGISRLTYVLLVVTAASLSAWGIAWAVGLTPEAAPSLGLPAGALLALRLLTSFAGVLGFALLFNTPFRIALGAAVIGMLCNTTRWYLIDGGLPMQIAAVAATTAVGLLAAWAGPRLLSPRITLSVPAVLIMIPGSAAYRALVYFNQGAMIDALANGATAVFNIMGMAVGLAIARMLTDRHWAFVK